MVRAQDIYDRSPVFVQNAMVTLSGAFKARQRYGKAYHQYRTWLRNYDTWTLDRMLDHQAQELCAFVEFAAQHSSFYRQAYTGRDLSEVSIPEGLATLPILEKEQLRTYMDDIYTVDERHSIKGYTGGTTGKSLVVRYTYDDLMRRMAVLDHFKSRHGFENRKMRRATFSGKHVVPPGGANRAFWRYNAAANQMLYSTFDISERNLDRYVEHLNEFKPEALDGFFTSLCDVAGYIERHEIPLKFKPVAIFLTSETVTHRGRHLLERVFDAKVYDQYASSEGAPFVTECTAGSLHTELSTGVFEHIPGTDEILVTSFHTHGTPLIRYRIGDSMRSGEGEQCTCGSPSPLVQSIQGRTDDYLLRVDGAKVNIVHVANLFKKMPNALVNAQIVQKHIDEIEVYLIVDRNLYREEHDDLLRREVLHTFGPKTKFCIHHVRDIPREASGKHRIIKNLVGDASPI